MDDRVFSFTIDRDNHIDYVNQAWIDFAIENGVPALPERAIGSDLFSHITGEEVRLLSREICNRVRRRLRPVELTYRCDSPGLRRYLTMRVVPLPGERLEFHNWIVRTEARPIVYLLDPHTERDNSLVRMCAWCKKVDVNAAWVEVEEAVRALRLFERDRVPGITHTICESCSEKVMSEIG
jgi:hypothetical protein